MAQANMAWTANWMNPLEIQWCCAILAQSARTIKRHSPRLENRRRDTSLLKSIKKTKKARPWLQTARCLLIAGNPGARLTLPPRPVGGYDRHVFAETTASHQGGVLMTLQHRFERGEFAVLAEMEPPKGTDTAAMVNHAKRVKERVAAFLVPEMNQAVMRMSALGGAMVLEQEGLETIMQMCCRDRNRLALQGDLLAAAACGVRNVLVVGGDDPSFGDHHQARAVHDISLVELLATIKTLQTGRDMAGVELSGTPAFLAGSTTQAGARGKSAEIETEEMLRRAEAGSRFFISAPLFDLDLITPYLARVDPQKAVIIPTVLLLKSVGMARYIERNMPHIFIPPELIDRIQRAPDKVRECVRVAVELVAKIKAAGFKGVMISTLGWEHKLPDIVEAI
jgi:5,10-methylenetetrahydrofolate reductase